MEYSLMQRNGYCRGCDKEMVKDEDMAIKMYSHRNRGQHIILCDGCVNAMNHAIVVHRNGCCKESLVSNGWYHGTGCVNWVMTY